MKKLKIVFIVNKIGFLELFSIPILSRIAKEKGHNLRLVEFAFNPKKAYKEVVLFEPDIIAYSICSNEANRYLEINSFFKKKLRFFSLFGGPHPTSSPSFLEKDNVDAICKGEGDLSFSEFLIHFNTDKMYETGNFSFKVGKNGFIENPLINLVEDLDSLPIPDRDIIYSKSYFLANNPIKTFFAGRGCPYKCTYCFNHSYNSMYKGKGKLCRTKSITYLVDEIKTLQAKYPMNFIKFHDDIFGADSGWLVEFAERYPREIGLPFLCYLRPNMVTENYCRQLKKAGRYSVCIAIESGNEHIRNSILNRYMSNEQIKRACEILKKFGLRIYALNMVGLPEESDKEILQTIELNQMIKPDFADASIFQPYPGTEIAKYCKNNGYLDEEFESFESQYVTSILNFEPDFKKRIFAYHKLFSVIVDFPLSKLLLNFLFKTKRLLNSKITVQFLGLWSRIYYGFNLHRKIYASKIPIKVLFFGVIDLLSSKNRV